MLPFLFFVPSATLLVLGIMYVTGKGLRFLVGGTHISKEEIKEYTSKRDAVNNCRFFGILMLVGAVYCALIAVGFLIRNNVMVAISTVVAIIVVAAFSFYYYTAKVLKAKGASDASNKNAKK